MKFKGTARIGSVTLRWPGRPTLIVDANGISLDGLCPFRLKKSEVKRLEYSDSFFSEGVLIVHTSPSVDPDIIFRPSDPTQLISAAKQLGYATIATNKKRS
jgi:hypothetical protein